MTAMWKVMDKNCKSRNIQLRPNAGNGLWLSGLLFACYLQTTLRNPVTVQQSYELSTVLLLGMFLQSLEVFFVLAQESLKFAVRIPLYLAPSLVTSSLLCLLLEQEILFSVITGLAVNFIYRCSFIYMLKSLPFSFTLGEASIVTQGVVVFLYNCFLKLPFMEEADSLDERLSLLLQLGMLGVLAIVIVSRLMTTFRWWPLFYLLVLSVIVAVCLVPIQNAPAIVILFNFVFSNVERIIVVGLYIVLISAAGFAVNWQISKNQKGTTSARKIFHILIVLVYVPGLIFFQCLLLYVASVIVLAIFIVLEVARVIKLYPVADALESSIQAFIDEKDAGRVALTPIYLLVGCSVPLWIHNSPCDLTGSSAFELLPLLSGVLSVGIGDTFASIVGSKIGRHKWWNGKKSVEGTLAGIISQAAFISALNYFGFIHLNLMMTAVCGVAVIANSLIEAFTDQVDNLVLPLVTYIVLAFK